MGFISQFLGKILIYIYENLSFGSYGLAIIFYIAVKYYVPLLSTVQIECKTKEIQPLNRKYKEV